MIDIQSGTLRAVVLTRGAALNGMWLDGIPHSLVLGSPDACNDEELLPYFGVVVGPVANRISGAEVEIEGKSWTMSANDGTACLHSGPFGLHALEWQIADQTRSSVTLSCSLAHGIDGMPGNREITARYSVSTDATLTLELSAISDQTTVINLAHHPYWNLDGTMDVSQHRLQVFAKDYLPVDENTLPVGTVSPVHETDYDFASPREIPTDITLDANYCLHSEPLEQPRKAAILMAPNRVTLQIDTTAPGLQIYNGSGLGPTPARLYDRDGLNRCAGIALEPQHWPDAPRNPSFPSIYLPAQTIYRQLTKYKISREFK